MTDWVGYLQFRPAFVEVMDQRYHTPEWLDEQVMSGAVKFMRSDHAAIIAEVRDYPTGAKDVHGVIAAGALDEIVEILIPQAEQWGLEQGCIGAIIESREGWARHLKPYGYEAYQLAVRKELSDGAQ